MPAPIRFDPTAENVARLAAMVAELGISENDVINQAVQFYATINAIPIGMFVDYTPGKSAELRTVVRRR